MSKLRTPYQCLKQCGNYLVAARGSSIDTFDIKDGSYLSTWKSPAPESTNALKTTGEETQTKSEEQNPETSTPDAPLESSTPPAKRRKLSVSEEKEEKIVVVQQLKKKAKNTPPKIIEPSPITALTITKDLQHVIAVTGEDKTIRVLAWEDTVGKGLKQISDRTMPKRPCALATTDDCSTIISADKFGDVYSLPLIPSPSVPSAKEDVSAEKQAPKKFQPSASALTVHSVRNLKALEAQKKQTNKVSEKTGPDFEHKLLLGHVSMLTDIVTASVSGRHYILTADRDEHIRVSRGIPQSHVIEGFCLGHIEYVSRLCIPSTRPETLISGGGDDDLHVWNWLDGSLLSKVDLKSQIEAFGPETTKDEPETESKKVAVTGIYHARDETSDRDIVCPCRLHLYSHAFQPTHTYSNHHPTRQCALLHPQQSHPSSPFSLIISIDNIHESGSIIAVKDDNSPIASPLQFFKYESEKFVNVQLEGYVSQDSEGILDAEKKNKLGGLLYNIGNLRKMEDEE
ncbi:putative trna methyltransferase protein [Botrytis fragariae]|uniref:Putative trna methyltransferase protein n=1 Tax=Botrytis fragariae TaxID=1964551 RepID=A0A8H6AX53_9HELO|nr:putative trna methyltransferase protein [Botrytis fragariae]KAF5875366.1 putative trna methyltransferase protein [Botrytis fragariae]